MIIIVLFYIIHTNIIANTYTTKQDGHWMSNSTWLNNDIPDPESIGNNDTVYIYYNVSL